jgi:hypothetical protein
VDRVVEADHAGGWPHLRRDPGQHGQHPLDRRAGLAVEAADRVEGPVHQPVAVDRQQQRGRASRAAAAAARLARRPLRDRGRHRAVLRDREQARVLRHGRYGGQHVDTIPARRAPRKRCPFPCLFHFVASAQ